MNIIRHTYIFLLDALKQDTKHAMKWLMLLRIAQLLTI